MSVHCRLLTADCPGIQHLGDIGVIHQRQRLALRLEAGDDLASIHARFNDFQGHRAADGMLLLGDEDQSHAALADLFHQLVRPNGRAGTLGKDRLIDGHDRIGRRFL